MTAEEIVRLLAAIGPDCDGDDHSAHADGCCLVCDGYMREHEPGCPWALAVEWARLNPRQGCPSKDAEQQSDEPHQDTRARTGTTAP